MEENALPVATPVAEASAPVVEAPAEIENQEGDEKKPEEAKPEKTPEQRRIAQLEKAIDRKTKRAAIAEARLEELQRGLTQHQVEANNRGEGDDSEILKIPRAEALKLIEQEALKRAPTIAKQQARESQLRAAAVNLKQALGEDFYELTDELGRVFNQPRQLDVLQAENPADLVRYLTDPENADEADAIAAMTHFEAGRAIAKLESKLAAAKAKPEASKAPAPIQPVRGSAKVTSGPQDSDPLDVWVKKERARLAALKKA